MLLRPFRRASRGFTLIEITVVLVIIAIFLAMAAVMFRGVAAAQKRSITGTRMATVDAALVQFVQLNKRLPCPANGTIAWNGVNPGVEVIAAGVCTGNQANGVVPWVTLGLTESDATDGWERRLTYRVDEDLVETGAMDMSWCDPAGTGAAAGATNELCNTACTNSALGNCTSPVNFLTAGAGGKGLRVQSITGTALMAPPNTGAAYVLISHGESGGGGYLNTGVLFTSTTIDGTEEQLNYANLVLRAYYVDDALTDLAGASHFDDLVSRPSVLALAAKAGLGPRSH
ncbi:MAG TPA: type II secretion system protein [Usitatibacter sp.]|nr:type II secretion system protein [Usitatibacter sp.]